MEEKIENSWSVIPRVTPTCDDIHKREVSTKISRQFGVNPVNDPRLRCTRNIHTNQNHYGYCETKLTDDVCSILSKVALIAIPILLIDDPFTMATYNCSSDSDKGETTNSSTTLPCDNDNRNANGCSDVSSSIFDLVKEAYAKHHRNHRKQKSSNQSPSLSESTSPKLFSQDRALKRHSQRLEHVSIRRSMQTPEFRKFIYELLRKTRMSSVALLLALKYIHRLRLNHPHARPSHGCEYRLFSVALILSNKYLEDKTFSNKTWSSLTRIQVHEINVMEREFLNILDYHLDIPDDEFITWIEYVEHLFQLYSRDDGSSLVH